MEKGSPQGLLDRVDHPFILASRVIGTQVFDPAGERLGHIDDLSIDKASGRAIYAIMSFGGFLGIGEKFHPVPWPLLVYDGGRDGFTVALDRSVLQNAPSYDTAELRELGGVDYRSYGDAIYAYYRPYGVAPFW